MALVIRGKHGENYLQSLELRGGEIHDFDSFLREEDILFSAGACLGILDVQHTAVVIIT